MNWTLMPMNWPDSHWIWAPDVMHHSDGKYYYYYCQPCTAGINISGIFVLEGYLQRYGLGDWAKTRYADMKVKAGECIGCGACESRCPYELPIRRMLARCKAEFGA